MTRISFVLVFYEMPSSKIADIFLNKSHCRVLNVKREEEKNSDGAKFGEIFRSPFLL